MLRPSRKRGSLSRVLLVAASLVATPVWAQVQYTFYDTYPATPPNGGAFAGGSVICSGTTGSSATGFQLNFNDLATRQALCPSNPDRFVPSQGDSFGARFTGILTAPSAGTYSLTIDSDDGDQLVVNGQILHTDWTVKAGGPGLVGSISLLAGANTFILDYFQGPPVGGFINLQVGPGLTVTPPAVVTAAPEPATFALVGGGLLGLAGVARRGRRRA